MGDLDLPNRIVMAPLLGCGPTIRLMRRPNFLNG
jgi:hypothetical protein